MIRNRSESLTTGALWEGTPMKRLPVQQHRRANQARVKYRACRDGVEKTRWHAMRQGSRISKKKWRPLPGAIGHVPGKSRITDASLPDGGRGDAVRYSTIRGQRSGRAADAPAGAAPAEKNTGVLDAVLGESPEQPRKCVFLNGVGYSGFQTGGDR